MRKRIKTNVPTLARHAAPMPGAGAALRLLNRRPRVAHPADIWSAVCAEIAAKEARLCPAIDPTDRGERARWGKKVKAVSAPKAAPGRASAVSEAHAAYLNSTVGTSF